jgi:uncharacterized protein YjbI with pentapeptide repeats
VSRGLTEPAEQRPAPDGYRSWNAYWIAQGMPWRTEPEIDEERQRYLTERQAVKSEIERDIYPFRDDTGPITLTRADVEWLLATHQSRGVTGPVIWDDEQDQPEAEWRIGLDLRGADLRQVDLVALPLSRIVAGLSGDDWFRATTDQRAAAAVSLAGAILQAAHLEGAHLGAAHLEDADLLGAYLEHAVLQEAQLKGANLWGAHLEGADLREAQLEGANLWGAHLEDADLRGADLQHAALWDAQLKGASHGDQERAVRQALYSDSTQGVPDDLASLSWWKADFSDSLPGVDLRAAVADALRVLRAPTADGRRYAGIRLADVRWGDVNLATLDWAQVRMLGDEWDAWHWKPSADEMAAWKILSRRAARVQMRASRQAAFEHAVRANHQLASALRDQGLHHHADRFTYRAQVLQRNIYLHRFRLVHWLFSWLLFVVAGYGYRPLRSVVTYVTSIGLFAVLYWSVTNDVSLTHGLLTRVITAMGMRPPIGASLHRLRGYEAIVLSMTSFHGGGFLQLATMPSDKVAILAALEAALGLVFEFTFLAAFIRRFFAR